MQSGLHALDQDVVKPPRLTARSSVRTWNYHPIDHANIMRVARPTSAPYLMPDLARL
jgi:hypothetical protein